jgi:hypothetical protein
MSTGTRVPANTEVPPNVSGSTVMSSCALSIAFIRPISSRGYLAASGSISGHHGGAQSFVDYIDSGMSLR